MPLAVASFVVTQSVGVLLVTEKTFSASQATYVLLAAWKIVAARARGDKAQARRALQRSLLTDPSQTKQRRLLEETGV